MGRNSVEFVIKTDNIKEIIAEKNTAVEKAMVECGLDMERYASESCPVDTGRLRNSITFATEHKQGKPNGHEGAKAEADDTALRGTPEPASVYVGTNVSYAPYIENGSSKRNPHPFLKPSIQNHLSEYKKYIENNLKG